MEPWEGYDRLTEDQRYRMFFARLAEFEDHMPRSVLIREGALALCAAVENRECLHKARKQRYSAVMVTVAQQAAEDVRSWSSGS